MGLLSRADTLEKITHSPGLSFSDYINKHSLKNCALLEKSDVNYIVKDSLGFDAHSILSATATIDFWNGICSAAGQIYYFNENDKSPLLQLFSFILKDSFKEFSVYKNKDSKILLMAGKLSDAAASDFENINSNAHINNFLTLNDSIKEDSVVVLFNIDFSKAAEAFFSSENKNSNLNFNEFLKSAGNEIYNRFSCRYTLQDAVVKDGTNKIKAVLITNKAYSAELIKNHLILNLKDVLGDFADQIQIDFSGTADSCEEVRTFLQVE